MRLTKRTVEAARPAKKEFILWDEQMPGFGVRVFPSGWKSYLIQYRVRGRTRRVTIGPHGVLTSFQARSEAMKLLASVRAGQDPSEARASARLAPTMADLCDQYLREHAIPHKKPRSADVDRQMVERFILPNLRSRKVADLSRAEILRLHHTLSSTPYQANRVLALLSKMFNLAEQWGLRPDGSNPVRHVRRFREQRRERFLSQAEMGRLGAALAEAEQERTCSAAAIAAIRLLIFTGCRLGEVLTLRWDYVDSERCVLRLPDSKTGARVVPLSAPALQVLSSIPPDASPWVIAGSRPEAHLTDLNKPWRQVRARAGLEGVRIHDLRHSFASVGAGAGIGLLLIGKILGHTQASTTERYAHLADDPLRQATEAIGQRVAAALDGAPNAEVVPLRGAG